MYVVTNIHTSYIANFIVKLHCYSGHRYTCKSLKPLKLLTSGMLLPCTDSNPKLQAMVISCLDLCVLELLFAGKIIIWRCNVRLFSLCIDSSQKLPDVYFVYEQIVFRLPVQLFLCVNIIVNKALKTT